MHGFRWDCELGQLGPLAVGGFSVAAAPVTVAEFRRFVFEEQVCGEWEAGLRESSPAWGQGRAGTVGGEELGGRERRGPRQGHQQAAVRAEQKKKRRRKVDLTHTLLHLVYQQPALQDDCQLAYSLRKLDHPLPCRATPGPNCGMRRPSATCAPAGTACPPPGPCWTTPRARPGLPGAPAALAMAPAPHKPTATPPQPATATATALAAAALCGSICGCTCRRGATGGRRWQSAQPTSGERAAPGIAAQHPVSLVGTPPLALPLQLMPLDKGRLAGMPAARFTEVCWPQRSSGPRSVG